MPPLVVGKALERIQFNALFHLRSTDIVQNVRGDFLSTGDGVVN